MKVLYICLSLKGEWYDMIESGIKKEEYREVKPYWIKRLCDEFYTDERCVTCIQDHCLECLNRNGRRYSCKPFDVVRFSYGYTKKTMDFEIKSILIGKGNSEWGAPDKEVFIIKLGNRLK